MRGELRIAVVSKREFCVGRKLRRFEAGGSTSQQKNRRVMKTAPGSKIQVVTRRNKAKANVNKKLGCLLAVRWKAGVVQGQRLQVLDTSIEYIDG